MHPRCMARKWQGQDGNSSGLTSGRATFLDRGPCHKTHAVSAPTLESGHLGFLPLVFAGP